MDHGLPHDAGRDKRNAGPRNLAPRLRLLAEVATRGEPVEMPKDHLSPPAPGRPAKGSGRWTAFLAGAGLGLATVLADAAWRRWRATPPGAPPGPPKGSPADIGPRGWRAILRRTLSEFAEDRIPAVAAGSTFFALLALFPALGVFVSLYGLVGDLAGAARDIAELQGVLPEGGVTVLREQVARLAAASHATLGLAFFVSLLFSVWSTNAGMKGLIAGLNVAYETRERRNFLELNLVSLAFTAGGIVFAMAATAAIAAAPDVLAWLHLQALEGASLLRWPAMLLVTAVVLSVLYRFAPCRHGARWRWITPGGVLAAVGWMAMSLAFSFYVAHFGRYDRTYGSLGAIVGFMTWIWLSLTIVLLGAEFNSELESQAERPGRTG
jgi:membrane protein